MPEAIQQPGLLFVLATLLPLASFVLLLILAAVRWGLRPYAKESPAADRVFQTLGGEVSGPGPAYFALGAIALSFLCCLVGFIAFVPDAHRMHDVEHELHSVEHALHELDPDHHHHEHSDKEKPGKKDKDHDPEKAAKEKKAKLAALNQKAIALRGELNELQGRWQDRFAWASVSPSPAVASDSERGTKLNIGFRIDMLSAVMFVMVTFVATLIHLFSIGYMADELKRTVEDHEVHTAHGHYERRGRFGRFFMFLSLFCFSMLNLLLADNLFQIFVSWELVGICSYLLISFYFERTSASNAANKAFITNRIGDAGFIIGLLIVWTFFGSFNFQEIFSRIRAPEADAHGNTKIAGVKAENRIIRAKTEEKIGRANRFVRIDPQGDVALIFPRVREMSADEAGHFDFPQTVKGVYEHPTPKQYGYIPYWILVVAGLGIFLGCVGKSAQFPLQVWLPDAMEGPTPVSALIHAATMVAAGVYLVGRCFPLFAPEVLLTIAYVGGITLFVAASIAVVVTDIKKVLAYSTVSQLGYMMLALGVGGWTAGLLHLLTHAFFKALLFLGSGSVIYGCHHQQDMLKMGGLYSKMKITALTMLMGVLAIAGTPMFSGWYSKDEILVAAYGFVTVHKQHFLLFLLPLITAGITTFYMFRMWFMTFTGTPRDEHVHEHAHESPWMMTVPLILLAILSVCVAWPLPSSEGWPLLNAEKSALGHELHHFSQPEAVDVDFRQEHVEAHKGHSLVGALALAVVLVGLLFALMLYAPPEWARGLLPPVFGVLDPADAKVQFPGVHRFLAHKWYFDEIYSAVLVRPSVIVAHWCRVFDTYVIDGFVHLLQRLSLLSSTWSGKFDRGIVDGLVNLISDVSYAVGNWLRNVQTGYLRSYVLFLALAAMAIWMLLYAIASAFGGV